MGNAAVGWGACWGQRPNIPADTARYFNPSIVCSSMALLKSCMRFSGKAAPRPLLAVRRNLKASWREEEIYPSRAVARLPNCCQGHSLQAEAHSALHSKACSCQQSHTQMQATPLNMTTPPALRDTLRLTSGKATDPTVGAPAAEAAAV